MRTRGGARPRSPYLAFASSLTLAALTVALVVSFLAAGYTSEARAPGLDDATAVSNPSPARSPEPAIAAMPLDDSWAYVNREPALVLAMATATPVDGSGYSLLTTAPRQSRPSPPRARSGPTVTETGPIHNVNITFYDCADQGFCGQMYGGEWVYEGAAACSWNLPLRTAFWVEGDPTRRIYVCKDRGLLDDTWVDIFWYHPDDGYDWQAHVGRYGTIHIVYLP